MRDTGLSYSEISRRLGIHRNVLLSIRKRVEAGGTPKHAVTMEQTDDTATVTSTGRISSLRALLEAAQVDLEQWSVKKWVANKWNALGKDSQIIDLWQVKAWLERIPPYLVEPVKPVKHLSRKPARSSETGLERALFIPDSQNGYRIDRRTHVHTPMHDRRAWDLAIQVAMKMQPEYVVLLGDMLDLAPFGKYTTEPDLHWTTMPTLIELHWYLGQLRLACPRAEIVWLEGNHEYRLRRMLMDQLKEAVDLRPVDDPNGPEALSVERLLSLKALDIEYLGAYPEAEYWLWDRIRVYHGTTVRKGSGASTAAIIRDTNVSVVCGHVHRLELAAKTTTSASGHTTVYAMCPGTICRIDGVVPGSTRRSNWQQGLGVANFMPDGLVTMEIMPIEDGRCVYNGAVLHGEDRVDEIRQATSYEWF